jgi:proton glutamate symport protein
LPYPKSPRNAQDEKADAMFKAPDLKKFKPERARRYALTHQIMLGLVCGIVVGALLSYTHHPEIARFLKPFSDLFLRLIKMIIAPIIFFSLVAGVAGAGHVKTIGRMGGRALLYFEVIAFFALALGLIMVNLTRPGDGVELPRETVDVVAHAQTWDQLILHTFPTSIVQAMAEGDVLQIVVFAILFAIALGTLKERAKPIVQLCEIGAEAMFKLTNMIMHYAPIGVGAAIAYTIGIAESGPKVLVNLAWLVGTLYATLALFMVLVLLPVALFFKVPIRKFLMIVREPAIIAFTTTSSEAALPRAMEGLERLGVPRRIVSFILPLGYSFNLDGTTLYLSLAAVFVAQVAKVEMSWTQQITMLITLMLTSKGVAAVPRASMVILAGTLAKYDLPLEGLSLILGVDTLMDMARTTVNVVGNSLATVVVAKWEGEFNEAPMADLIKAREAGDI